MKTKAIAFPYLVCMVFLTIIPLLLIGYYSVTTKEGSFSLDNFRLVFQPIYLSVIWRSVRVALISTIICFILGYPIAYILASKQFVKKGFLLFLFIVPMWMNFLLRTYAWLTILENNGIINTILRSFGFSGFRLLYRDGSVILGMVYNYLPFMILPIYTVLTKMDHSLVEAASDLGADKRKVFIKIVFPLSIPGVASGITMVFMPSVTTFVISNLLGGEQYMLIGNLIEQQFLRANNWHFGAALAVIMIVIILISNTLFTIFDKDNDEGAKK